MSETTAEVLTAIGDAEDAVDRHPMLTRRHATLKHAHTGSVIFTRDGVRVAVACRGEKATGRGAKRMHEVAGNGETLSEAVTDFHRMLAYWADVLNGKQS
jgi:hypothetical protein